MTIAILEWAQPDTDHIRHILLRKRKAGLLKGAEFRKGSFAEVVDAQQIGSAIKR
jgi:hypothetical protein